MGLLSDLASHSKLKRMLVISGIILAVCLMLFLLLTMPAVCIGVCAATGHTLVSACFISGDTHNIALDSLFFDRGVCLYLCGQTVRHVGACNCPNGCSASLGRGACTDERCVCADGWGGADCNSVMCPRNRCSGHGTCISDESDTDRCECNAGWTAHDCSAPVVRWNATPAGELCEQSNYAADDYGDAHPLWNMSEIATVRITMKSKHLDRLIDANTLWTADYEKADFEFRNSRIHGRVKHVGVKVRGANTRKMTQKSWSVSFTKYDKHRRWLGLRKINLRAHAEDSSMLRHTVGITMYRSMCIPTYRSSVTMVWINGISYGLYNMVEDLDRDFLMSRFGESDGNLYKPSQPCASLSYISEDPEFYQRYQCQYAKGGKPIAGTCSYEQAEGSGDWSDFADLISTMHHAAGPARLAQIGSKLSLASWTRATAVDVAMARYDGYAAYGNNWYMYRRKSDGLFYTFSADFSSDMQPETVTYPLLPFNTSWPRYWSRCGPWNRILYMQSDSVEMQRSLISLARNFSRSISSKPAIIEQLQILREQLAPLVAADPYFTAIGGVSAWTAACEELVTVLRDRSEWLQDETHPLSEVSLRSAVYIGACIRAAVAAIAIAVLALCCLERADCTTEETAPPTRPVVSDDTEDLLL